MPAPGQLSLVVFSGDPAKVHYALMMASSAVAIGKRATLFFTMEAIRALAKGKRLDGDGEELLAALVELGAKFMLCEAGLRAVGLARADLREDLKLVECGLVTFLNDCAPDGQIVFV